MQKEQRDKEHTPRRAAKILRRALNTRINRIHASPPLWMWWSVPDQDKTARLSILTGNLHPIAHLYLSLTSQLSIGFLYLLAKWKYCVRVIQELNIRTYGYSARRVRKTRETLPLSSFKLV